MKNEKIRIVVVEDNEHEQNDFAKAAEKFPDISISLITGRQSDALDFIANNPVDAVVLDLVLEEGDGLSLLDCLKEELLISPFVIVITNNESVIISHRVRESGADFIFHKSNAVYSAQYIFSFIMKTAKYFIPVEMQRESMNKEILLETQLEKLYGLEIDRRFGNLKIYTNYKGMIFAKDAILYVLMSEDFLSLQVKELYISIAQKYNTDYKNIERNIRTWIERAWGNADQYSVKEYYGGVIDPEKGKPTNKQFIFQIAMKVKEASVINKEV